VRKYFVAQFLLFAVLAAAMGANWWVTLTRADLYLVAVPAAVLAGGMSVYCFVMAVVAFFTRYRA
jgi:hypothetical protein